MPRISNEQLAQLRWQALAVGFLPRQSGPESIASFEQVRYLLEDLHEARLQIAAEAKGAESLWLVVLNLTAELEVRTSRPVVHAEIPPQCRGRKKHSAWLHGYWEGWRGQKLQDIPGGEAAEAAAKDGHAKGAAAASAAIALKVEELKAKTPAKEGKPCAG